MEKLASALVTVARNLKPYFQAYTIIVLTNQPLKRVMSSPEAAKRKALWAIELSKFDIQYRPRTAIKGQIVADFITEYTQPKGKGAEGLGQWSIQRTDHQTSTQEVPVSLYKHQKGIKSNA